MKNEIYYGIVIDTKNGKEVVFESTNYSVAKSVSFSYEHSTIYTYSGKAIK